MDRHSPRPWRIASVLAALLAAVAVAASTAVAAPVNLVAQLPARISIVAPGVMLVDFGRVAFGNLRITPPEGATGAITVHFGEALAGGRVNRTPPGSVRYSMTRVSLAGVPSIVAAPPADTRHTRQPAAILTPPEWGVVTPFRWVEIEGWPGELGPEHLRRQAAFASTWDDRAAAFRSSDDLLDRIWELCRYSIKATTFAGVYIDGDRERIPYEADAYLNQLSHYSTDRDVQMARDTFDRLMSHPTWPTEWASAHANLFPLAFGLVPAERAAGLAGWLGRRGMACSVYAAQYLLEGLFEHGAGVQALGLITAPTDRSWRHMVESGTTITWEAWDQTYKPNQDWNHAWGAAPANLLPRFVLGAQPLTPGWRRARIRPVPGLLTRASGTIPTPRGPIQVAWINDTVFTLTLTVPQGMTAQVELPAPAGSRGVFSRGTPVRARRVASRWLLDEDVAGFVTLEVR